MLVFLPQRLGEDVAPCPEAIFQTGSEHKPRVNIACKPEALASEARLGIACATQSNPVPMHRFYLPPEACEETSLRLEGREAHHALHVLRLREQDAIEILDGCGGRYQCRVAQREKQRLILSVESKSMTPAPPWRLTLLAAVTKSKALDMIVQKATELGVSRLVPLITERVVVKTSEDRFNLDKWRWVAIDSIKQCGSPWLPAMEPPVTLARFIERRESFDLSWVASLVSSQHPRKTIDSFRLDQQRPPRSVSVWIGPEGDFKEKEIRAITDAGAQPISLGSLVLRADTAAIYCLSVLNYELRFMEESK